MSEEENRATDFPNLIDFNVADNLKGLRKVFKTHNRILSKLGESYPFYPDELKTYIGNVNIYELWKQAEYSTIEEIYVYAWISYLSDIFEEPVYFTVEEFLDGTAEYVLEDWFAV